MKKSNAVSETQRDAPAVRAASLTHPDHARTALDVGGASLDRVRPRAPPLPLAPRAKSFGKRKLSLVKGPCLVFLKAALALFPEKLAPCPGKFGKPTFLQDPIC